MQILCFFLFKGSSKCGFSTLLSCPGFIMCSLIASCIFIWTNKDDDDDFQRPQILLFFNLGSKPTFFTSLSNHHHRLLVSRRVNFGESIAVIKFWVNIWDCDDTGWFEIKAGLDKTRFTNMTIAGFRAELWVEKLRCWWEIKPRLRAECETLSEWARWWTNKDTNTTTPPKQYPASFSINTTVADLAVV